jgi:hypothetical protein
MSLPLLVRPADRAIDLPIASLSLHPAGVITPTTHRRLPSDKPSRHALPVRLPCFSHARHMIFLSQTGELRQSKKHVRMMPLVFGYVPWMYSSSDLPGSSDPSRGHAGATNL